MIQIGTKAQLNDIALSAIQFPNNEALPLDLIKRIVEFRKKENEEINHTKILTTCNKFMPYGVRVTSAVRNLLTSSDG
jgi:hypothetical protein